LPCANDARGNWEIIYVTKKEDDGSTSRAVVEIEPPKLAKGESLMDGILRLQRRGRELRADLHRIESSCFPSSYCKQRMREQIEQLAMQGAPSVSRLVELDGPVDFQTHRLQSEVLSEQRVLAFSQVPDVIGLFAWMHKPALIAALDAEIDAEADDGASLTHEARQLRTAETMGDLLAVERDECALVWRAMDERLPCEFRADCDPLAILQIQLITTPHAAPPPSSPERAGYNQRQSGSGDIRAISPAMR
jgi:hypothetical protein